MKQTLKQKIKDYTPILKEDEDFDYSYILIMLIFKLKRTREHIVGHDFFENAKRVGAEIQKVENLLTAVLEDKYYEKLEEKIIKKYGKIVQKVIPNENKDSKWVRLNFSRTKETEKNWVVSEFEYINT